MIDFQALQIGDTYEENGVTYEVVAVQNNDGQLSVTAKPVL